MSAIINAAPISGQAAITEATGILTAVASVLVRGAGAVTEQPDLIGEQAAEAPDTAAGAGRVVVTAGGEVVEAPHFVTGAGVLPGAFIQEAPDTAAGTGAVSVTGVAGIAEAGDTVLSAALGVTKLSAARVTFTLNTSTGNQIVSYGPDQDGKESIAPRPSGCATGHPSPPGALGLAASDSFCRDRPALTCATSLRLARKLAQ
jgi:hypothetical protein